MLKMLPSVLMYVMVVFVLMHQNTMAAVVIYPVVGGGEAMKKLTADAVCN